MDFFQKAQESSKWFLRNNRIILLLPCECQPLSTENRFSISRSDWFKNNFPLATVLNIHLLWEPSQTEGSFVMGVESWQHKFYSFPIAQRNSYPPGMYRGVQALMLFYFVFLYFFKKKMINLSLALKPLAHTAPIDFQDLGIIWRQHLHVEAFGKCCGQNGPILTHVLNSIWFPPLPVWVLMSFHPGQKLQLFFSMLDLAIYPTFFWQKNRKQHLQHP